MLEVDGITRTYGGLTAVDDVGFTVEAGEIVGVIGPNGAGKTTLFNAVTGVETPDSGTVRLHEKDLTGVRPNAACRAGVARTFQSVRTFDESTVRENALAGALFGGSQTDREPATAAANDAIEFVGLADHADRHASDLPVAARKRVELARALATDPEVLLLDEIGSGLTPVEIDDLTDIILRIRDERGVTVLWIEHVTDALFRGVDRVLVLDNGSLIAEGTPAEIRTDDRVAEAYLGDTASTESAATESTATESAAAEPTASESAAAGKSTAGRSTVTGSTATDGGGRNECDDHHANETEGSTGGTR